MSCWISVKSTTATRRQIVDERGMHRNFSKNEDWRRNRHFKKNVHQESNNVALCTWFAKLSIQIVNILLRVHSTIFLHDVCFLSFASFGWNTFFAVARNLQSVGPHVSNCKSKKINCHCTIFPRFHKQVVHLISCMWFALHRVCWIFFTLVLIFTAQVLLHLVMGNSGTYEMTHWQLSLFLEGRKPMPVRRPESFGGN